MHPAQGSPSPTRKRSVLKRKSSLKPPGVTAGPPPLLATLVLSTEADAVSSFTSVESPSQMRSPGRGAREFEGITGLTCWEDKFVVIHDGVVDVAQIREDSQTLFATGLDEVSSSSKRDPFRSTVLRDSTANPYHYLDATPTECERAVRVQRTDAGGTKVSTHHGFGQTQGSVVGQPFSEGMHLWTLKCTQWQHISIGIVSMVGIGHLQCSDGSVPEYHSSLRQGPRGDFRVFWRTAAGLEHSKECLRPVHEVMQGSASSELQVLLDFTWGRVVFLCNGVNVGIVRCEREGEDSLSLPFADCAPRLVGEHTVAVHLKSNCEVEALYRPAGNAADGLVSIHPSTVLSPVLGNPFMRWDHVDGKDLEVGMIAPCGATFVPPPIGRNEGPRLFVVDRGALREVNMTDRTCVTRQLTVEGLPGATTSDHLFLFDVCAMQAMSGILYATDLWNAAVLEIVVGPASAASWQARAVMKRCFGSASLGDTRHQISEAQSLGVARGVYGPHVSRLCGGFFGGTSGGASGAAASLSGSATFSNSFSMSMKSSFSMTSGTRGRPDTAPSRGTRERVPWSLGPTCLAEVGTWLFVTDSRRHAIYGWDTDSRTSDPVLICGCPGSPGDKDGWGLLGRLRCPTGICADESTLSLYVADTGNNRVVKVMLRYYNNRYEGCILPVDLVLEAALGDPDEPLELHRPTVLTFMVRQTTKYLIIGESARRKVYQVGVMANTNRSADGSSISAPLERLMDILRALRSGPAGKGDDGFQLDEAIDILRKSKNIYMAQIVRQGNDMDEEVALWLKSGYVDNEGTTGHFEEEDEEEDDETDDQVRSHRESITAMTPGVRRAGSIRASVMDRKSALRGGSGHSGLVRACIREGPELARVEISAADLCRLDYDVWTAEDLCHDSGGALHQMMLNVFSQYRFTSRYNINRKALLSFCRVMQMGYHDNPYHNATHAADVLQTVHAMLQQTNLTRVLSDIDVLALLFAASVHDYDHPGVNNQFLINTKDPLALRYNDQSVLESHHVAQVFEIMASHPECDWTCSMNPHDRTVLRELVIHLVQGTDMKQHFSLLSQFRTRVQSLFEHTVIPPAPQRSGSQTKLSPRPAGSRRLSDQAKDRRRSSVRSQGGAEVKLPELEDEDKRVLLRSLLHSADISNPTKPTPTYLEWADRVMQEFAYQGEEEKKAGLDYSPFCEPHTDMAKCQKGFIDFVVRPQFEPLLRAFPTLSEFKAHLETNYTHWQQRGSRSQG